MYNYNFIIFKLINFFKKSNRLKYYNYLNKYKQQYI